jgi:hypothetical protein
MNKAPSYALKPSVGARVKHFLLLVMVGLIPVISGMLILYWQVDRSLTRASVEAGQRAISQLDRTIERADDLAARASNLVGKPCTEVLEPMRRLVASYPAVRSLALGDQESLYCGSELGVLDRTLASELAGAGRLLLRASSSAAPNRPSMVFRREEDAHTLYAVIDGQVLGQSLSHANGSAGVLLEQNGLFLNADGEVTHYQFNSHGEHHSVQMSSLYGYRVHSGYAAGQSMVQLKMQALPMFGTLLLLGVVTAGVCHWLSRQKPAPRRYSSR